MIQRKPRILVVDPDTFETQKLENILMDSFIMEVTDKPEKALLSIQKKHYDVVLCELCFEGAESASGISLLKQIRQKYENYRFLLFSQDPDPNLITEALNLNADGFIRKPVSEEAKEILQQILMRETFSAKRFRQKDYGMENELNLIINGQESDLLNAMEIIDQMVKVLYPPEYGDFGDLKIALYEALNNAKLYGCSSNPDRIHLKAEFKHDRIICHVKDPGTGFDVQEFLPKIGFESKNYGGIHLIDSLTDAYSFNSAGTEINFLKLLKTSESLNSATSEVSEANNLTGIENT